MVRRISKNRKSKHSEDYPSVKDTDWASWLKANHEKQRGVWVVFAKKFTNLPSMSFEEALDIALAYGWIDISIRKIDEKTFGRKFTPRRPESAWSSSNIERAEQLITEGKMTMRGLEVYKRRLNTRGV
jgi:uncharacterized protein YdeI (YjbR/CyaY-like superfamily)